MIVSNVSVQCRTLPSWTDVWAPTTTRPVSPRSTAVGQIEASAPTITSPMMTASGWTNAVGWIVGVRSPMAYRAMCVPPRGARLGRVVLLVGPSCGTMRCAAWA